MIKRELPGYVAGEELYQSGRTVVWRARRTLDDTPVVLKAPVEGTPHAGAMARYEREARRLRQIEHRGVIKCYGVEKIEECPVLVLAEVPGAITLADEIQEAGLSTDRLIFVWIRIAEALGAIHAQSTIHKDINPTNILIDPTTSDVKIIDFDCASDFVVDEPLLGSPRSLEGTLAYMSPEQTGRANRTVDYRSDFYSLGVTFYELATGRLPFESQDAMDLVYSHLARRPEPIADRRPEFPKILSDVVTRLMEKAAEDRYQSAAGLQHDLDAASRKWQASGRISYFSLGQSDPHRLFRVAEKLYGRDAEVRALLDALELASRGRPRLVLVDGASGTGKTSVIQETYKPLARQRGFFIRGKFDQFKRDIPFGALVQAFQELIRQLLTEPDDVLARWKARLQFAVAANGSVLTEVIPELRWLLGSAGPVPELNPVETQNRFHTIFRNFLDACAQQDHPLVIFLDDLQWADVATLHLLNVVLTSTEEKAALLVVGAYRTHEVDDAHPLVALQDALAKASAPVDRITLGPLDSSQISMLLTDTLSCQPSEVVELTSLLWERTRGNPFFLHQFLALGHKVDALGFDEAQGRWRWDLNRLRDQNTSGGVVELLLERLKQTTLSSQTALGLAACMGAQFHLNWLALALEKSSDDTLLDLTEALQDGLIVPFGTATNAGTGQARVGDAAYRFMHDRVQQAAYLLVPEVRRRTIHLQIGRRMLDGSSPRIVDEQLFDIVDHFWEAVSDVTDSSERRSVADLFFRAAVKAKRATAYQPAVRYLRAALKLLPINAWEVDYGSTMGVHREMTECAYLVGDAESSDRMGAIALQHAKSVLDRVPIFIIQIQRKSALRDVTAAIQIGIRALRQLGMPIHERMVVPSIAIEMLRVLWRLRNRSSSELEETPAMRDPIAIARAHLLSTLVPPAYIAQRTLIFLLFSFKILSLSLRYGFFVGTRTSFLTFAMVMIVLGRTRDAIRYADLSFSLSRREPNASNDCMTYVSYGVAIHHWLRPARDGVGIMEKSYQLGIESGNHQYASYALYTSVLIAEFLASSVDELDRANQRAKAFFKRLPNALLQAGMEAVDLVVGLTVTIGEAEIAQLEDQLNAWLAKSTDLTMSPLAPRAMLLHMLFGSKQGALYLALLADREAQKGYSGIIKTAVHYLYHSVLMTDAYEARTLPRRKYRSFMRRNEMKVASWARDCPSNYEHYAHFIRAEWARGEGRLDEALRYYDLAIAAAEAGGYNLDRAIANERAARVCAMSGRTNWGRIYVAEAHSAYKAWGALRKVRALEREFAFLQPSVRFSEQPESPLSPSLIPTAGHIAQIDVTTIIKAAQALSGERDLDKLLAQLMMMVIENAGAQKGFLILTRKGELSISAMFEADQLTVGLQEPLAQSTNLALSVVQYVARTQQPVVLDDVRTDERFDRDPYVARGNVVSVLSLAMSYQTRLTGVIYLENNELKGAFPPGRTSVIDLIASHAAIAIENALLVTEISANNQLLETKIGERTQDLERTLMDLWGEMNLAKKIQTILLPADGSHGGYEIAAAMMPAEEVGGDYYDVIPTETGNWVLIGDVSGHGITAGLIMMMVQTSARTLLINDPTVSPSALLSQVNRSVIENLHKIGENNYMTIQAFCLVGPQLTYAGLHQEIVIYRSQTNDIEVLQELNGMWIGINEDIADDLIDNNLTMNTGDIMLLFTDGITEARRDNKMLELDGLVKIFRDRVQEGIRGAALVSALIGSVTDYTVNDDISVMLVQRR